MIFIIGVLLVVSLIVCGDDVDNSIVMLLVGNEVINEGNIFVEQEIQIFILEELIIKMNEVVKELKSFLSDVIIDQNLKLEVGEQLQDQQVKIIMKMDIIKDLMMIY